MAKKNDKIDFCWKKGLKAKYKAFAESQGMSLTELITKFLDDQIEVSGFKYEEENEQSDGTDE